MSDAGKNATDVSDGHAHHETGVIHLPPNSLVPLNVAIALAVLFVGFLNDIRAALGPAMWLLGLIWLIAACVQWVRTARREYVELPEDGEH